MTQPTSATGLGEARPPLVFGRDAELSRLRDAWFAAASGHGGLYTIAGDAGIGKTALCDALHRHVEADGGFALRGRCWESGGAPAYAPWVQALRRLTPADVERLPKSAAGFVARLVPELGGMAGSESAAPAIDTDEARFALFDAVAELLTRTARERPILLMLDDLHAADVSSLLMLRFVARTAGGARLLAVGAYREVEAHLAPEVGGLITDLNREGERIHLRGLGPGDVAALAAARTGAPVDAEMAASLHAASDGNPFFAGELAPLLAAGGGARIPAGVRDLVASRLHRANPETRHVLAAGAVVGREFSLRLMEAVCGLPVLTVAEHVDRGAELGLLAEAPDAPGHHRFNHGLMRDALYDGLPPELRADLHRRVGAALEGVHGESVEPHLAELAHHFIAGDEAGKATDYAAGAGDRANRLLAHDDAAWHYRRALEALDESAPDDRERRCDLLLSLGDAEWRAGHPDPAKEAFLAAGEHARALGDGNRLTRAALGYGGRYAWVESTGEVDEPLVALIDDALAAQPPGDSALRAQLTARLSMQLYNAEGAALARRDDAGDVALAMARRLGDQSALAHALNARRYLLWHTAGVGERLAAATELMEVAEAAEETELAMRAHAWRIIDLLEAGDREQAEAAVARQARLAEELRQPLFLLERVKWLGLLALLEGRLADAERHVLDHLRLAQEVPDPLPVQSGLTQLYTLRFMQGRVAEMADGVRAFADRYPRLFPWRCALALSLAETGRVEEAREEVDRIDAGGFFEARPLVSWAVACGTLAEGLKILGDTARAEKTYAKMRPYAGLGLVIGFASAWNGAADRSLGVLATMLGDLDLAERHLGVAREMNERVGSPFWLAWTWIDEATLLTARDRPGDRERARELAADAARTAAERGFGALAWRAAEVLTAAAPR